MPTSRKNKIWNGPSNSEQYLHNRSSVPQVSALMAQGVSQSRRESLASEVEHGLFRDGSSSTNKEAASTANSNVVASVGIKKIAQVVSGGGFRGGSGDTVKQTPEVYSPLWLNSNLSLPRDRATINAWCRSFYALNPFVHNAINLHSTYPISKLNIKCPNKEIEKFFNDMIEEIDLMNVCVSIAQEYWLLGEAFVYAELDESQGKWSRLLIQNPDYMVVKRTVVANEPTIMLRPDENLKKIIFSNKPTDIEQRKQLNQHIIDSVKRGDNIAIDNFHISHLARRISPYEIRGTGLPVCVFRQLMLFDKLKECYSEDTEILTDKGFNKIKDLVRQSSDISLNPNYVNGVLLDVDGSISSILTMKEDFKVACVNPENNTIEYHKPIEMHMSQHNGEMIHFKSRNVDCLVTPNHNMWVQKANRLNGKSGWSDFNKVKAKDISPTATYRFQGITNWEGKNIEYVQVLDKQIPIELYLKFMGYVISEGYLGQNYIDFVQKIDSDCIEDIKNTVRQFASIFDLSVYEREIATKDYKKAGFKKQPSNRWNARINSKSLMNYFIDQIGTEKSTSAYKKIPTFIKSLDKDLLSILLETLVLGDGSHLKNKKSLAWKYYTISKQLSDDVQEIAFKCGFAPSIYTKIKSKNTEYCVSWSDAADGNYPILTPNKKYPPKINKENYNGVVWCFEVPTGLFITRRNGQITIQGNSKFAQADNMINPLTLVKVGSADFKPTFADLEAWRNVFEEAQYDKDFKVFTHEGVTVERVGYTGINDISADITQAIKEIYVGLQVPSVLMDGGADTTYANGGVALDVLRQRYMQFRNMMSTWLKRKIFAPISKIQGFYDYSHGEKMLIVPDIDWNHMSLFDAGDYINTLLTLTQGEGDQKRASLHTLYRSLGLEFEDETRKLRKEAIQSEIAKKEKAALTSMNLNSLRTIDDEDEITEPQEAKPTDGAGGAPGEMPPPLPGEMPPDLSAPPPGGDMPPPPMAL